MTHLIKKFSQAVYLYCEKTAITHFLLIVGFLAFVASAKAEKDQKKNKK